MILTTEALVTDKPEKNAPAMPLAAAMGGMDFYPSLVYSTKTAGARCFAVFL